MKHTKRFLVSALVVASVTLFTTGCHKDKDTLPVITTVAVTDIDMTSAVCGGTITDDGGSAITERGICWSTTANPTINDFIAVDHTDGDAFEINITSLQWATTYYVRAYATNSLGTAYGESVTFNTATPNALVYVDSFTNDDKVEEALAAQRCNVTNANGPSDFATRLASGNYDLVVLFSQGSTTSSYSSIITLDLITNFINGGGLMIYATWDASDNNYAALFNASLTGVYNVGTVTMTDPLMIAKVGASSFTLANPGYGNYSTGMTALTGGTVLATFENNDAAMILGNEGHTMMLGYLSDTPSTKIQEIFESVLMKINASI